MYAKWSTFSSVVPSMAMFGAVAVSGCAGWKRTFVFDTLTVKFICFRQSIKEVGLRVGSNSTVISVLQIYDGCCFHFCLGFNAALPVGAIDYVYT